MRPFPLSLMTFLAVSIPMSQPVAAEDVTEALAACDETLEQSPDHPRAYRCYWIVGRQHAAWTSAVAHVERLLANDPYEHRARLSLALLAGDLGDWDRSLPLLHDVVRSFSDVHDARGEIYARHNLAYLLITRGDFEEAETLLDRGERVATASGDAMLQVAIYVEQAYLAQRRGDFGLAWTRYRHAGALLVDGHPVVPFLRSRILTGLADAAKAAARYRDAMEIFLERAALLRAVRNPFDESFARLDAAWMAERLWREGKLSRAEVEALSNEALRLAQRANNERAAAEARLLHARFLPVGVTQTELDRALAYGLSWGEHAFLSRVYRALATHARDRGADGRAFSRKALAAAHRSGDPVEIAASFVELAEVEWADDGSPTATALEVWDRAIEAVENVRNLQPDDAVRARFLADWSFVYDRMASLVLDRYRKTEDPTLLDKVFLVSERKRSRVLLDRLDALRATPAFEGNETLSVQHTGTLSAIVAVQKKLLNNELGEGEREHLVDRLDELERVELGLRHQLARLDPETASIRQPTFPSLSEVEVALRDDEALLSFHVSVVGGRDGELPLSWLQVSTRDGTSVVGLASRDVIEPAIDFFLGLVKRRDGSDELGARRLYELLLADALEHLTPSIHRLIVVPDGKLHGVPFGALHDGTMRLIETFEISVVPSVTAAWRWRERRAERATGGALVLADPTPWARTEPMRGSGDRMWALATGETLGSLPHARSEGRAVASLVGGNSLFLERGEASESYLKNADLTPYSVLHFAAHGIVDETNPQRSAILLAPGADDEDGLLQLRDITELDASGKLVVLSACRSASGELLRGEGVMGIARAFFQAGAHAVVGGLWSLNDREASIIFESFYRHLDGDTSTGAALRKAQIELLERGAETAAWAGVVALGDAGVIPRTPPRLSRSLLLTTLFALAAISLFALARHSRAHA